jgi:hypothetical protein
VGVSCRRSVEKNTNKVSHFFDDKWGEMYVGAGERQEYWKKNKKRGETRDRDLDFKKKKEKKLKSQTDPTFKKKRKKN